MQRYLCTLCSDSPNGDILQNCLDLISTSNIDREPIVHFIGIPPFDCAQLSAC